MFYPIIVQYVAIKKNSGSWIFDMRIKQALHQVFPGREIKAPRAIYKDCYRDLYRLYDRDISEETFVEGGQYTQSELGEALLETLRESMDITRCDPIVCVFYTPEFDSKHSSCAAYFVEHFKLQGRVFDVSDAGTLGPFIALKVIDAYLDAQPGTALLLGMEQTTVPREKASHDLIPNQNEAALWALSSEDTVSQDFEISHVEVMLENEIMSGRADPFQFLKEYVARCSLDHLRIIVAKGSLIAKKIAYAMAKKESVLTPAHLHFMSTSIGTVRVLAAVKAVLDAEPQVQHILVIDEDVESLKVGVLCLEKK